MLPPRWDYSWCRLRVSCDVRGVAAAMLVGAVCAVLWGAAVAAAGAGARRAHRDVTTAQGTVRGYLAARPPHYEFMGLPYSRPLLRADRFKSPEAPPQWDGTFEAVHREKCPQPSGEGSEFCLVANVFVPAHAAACCPLPVLVVVHDGGFQSGWGAHHAPMRFIQKNFVVVTFNYRVGVLGFLCLGTPEIPGNAGIKDQVAALYWVYENIGVFGGNPLDITVYGVGSGAVSVQLLLLSGAIKYMARKVILESGSVLSPSAMTYNPLSHALNTASALGYEDEGNINDLVKFYVRMPTKELVNITSMFLPCVENKLEQGVQLIDRDPMEMLLSGNIDKMPAIISYTIAEESMLIEDHPEKFTATPENFLELLPNNLEFDGHRSKHRVGELVRDFYFDEEAPVEGVVQSFADYIDDVFMEYPVVKFALLYATRTSLPVYLMKFTYKDESERMRYGAVFNYLNSKVPIDHNGLPKEPDELVTEKLFTLWTNFMTLGDPTPLTSTLLPVIWHPVNFTSTTKDITKISCLLLDTCAAMSTPDTESLKFWDQLYVNFYRQHTFDVHEPVEVRESDDLEFSEP